MLLVALAVLLDLHGETLLRLVRDAENAVAIPRLEDDRRRRGLSLVERNRNFGIFVGDEGQREEVTVLLLGISRKSSKSANVMECARDFGIADYDIRLKFTGRLSIELSFTISGRNSEVYAKGSVTVAVLDAP